MNRYTLATKLRTWADRLDGGPLPGQLLELQYTPAVNYSLIYEGKQVSPPGEWRARVRVHIGSFTGKVLSGVMTLEEES